MLMWSQPHHLAVLPSCGHLPSSFVTTPLTEKRFFYLDYWLSCHKMSHWPSLWPRHTRSSDLSMIWSFRLTSATHLNVSSPALHSPIWELLTTTGYWALKYGYWVFYLGTFSNCFSIISSPDHLIKYSNPFSLTSLICFIFFHSICHHLVSPFFSIFWLFTMYMSCFCSDNWVIKITHK